VQHDALEEAAVLLQEGAARVELRLQGRHEASLALLHGAVVLRQNEEHHERDQGEHEPEQHRPRQPPRHEMRAVEAQASSLPRVGASPPAEIVLSDRGVQRLIDDLDRVVEQLVLGWRCAERLDGLQRLVDERQLVERECEFVPPNVTAARRT
jgi:hypothetical protein